MDKLNPKQDFQEDYNAQLACLGIRIGLDFDGSRETGRKVDMKLAESYMRIIFAVPKHREFMRSGAPSEPILAEAAARLLNSDCDFETLAPTTLSMAFQRGFLARWERGEMVGRLLWTLAHDKVLRERTAGNVEVLYHKPILLVDFLKALFHPEHLETILNARPVGDRNGRTISKAFENAYIYFLHFVDGIDHDVAHLDQVYRLLFRGAALNCRRNQPSIDFLTPILFGTTSSTPISLSKSSVFQAQIKNRNEPRPVTVSPTLVCSEHHRRPVLSLVHELGSAESKVEVVINELHDIRSGKNSDQYHYQIVAHGCGSETYRVIPKDMDRIYPQLIGSNLLMEDFPRRKIPCCASQLKKMDIRYGLERKKHECWWFGKEVDL